MFLHKYMLTYYGVIFLYNYFFLNAFIDRNESLKVVLNNYFMLFETKILLLAKWFSIMCFTN